MEHRGGREDKQGGWGDGGREEKHAEEGAR